MADKLKAQPGVKRAMPRVFPPGAGAVGHQQAAAAAAGVAGGAQLLNLRAELGAQNGEPLPAVGAAAGQGGGAAPPEEEQKEVFDNSLCEYSNRVDDEFPDEHGRVWQHRHVVLDEQRLEAYEGWKRRQRLLGQANVYMNEKEWREVTQLHMSSGWQHYANGWEKSVLIFRRPLGS